MAICILAVTMFDWKVGMCGLIAVLCTNGILQLLGFSKHEIEDGIYGFNAVLLGLGLGKIYLINFPFVVLFFISILTLIIITIWIKTNFAHLKLPFLSFPFIATLCIVLIVSRGFDNIQFDMSHLFLTDKLILEQNTKAFQLIHSLDEFQFPNVIKYYFLTLSNTFFIQGVLGGVIISLGLLVYSRIAFTLSFIGFFAAYYIYSLLGAKTTDLTYYLQGSNFIFLSIAIGGFFIVPSIYSYISVVALIPVLIFINIAINKVFFIFQIPSYTLGFSILTTMFLYMLQQRYLERFLKLVWFQYYQPEKVLYKQLNHQERFEKSDHLFFSLPVIGEWMVSQGHKGKITHIGEWSDAIDLIVLDASMKPYKDEGIQLEDFYCYNKPVIAPADGYIYSIINHIDDNKIGEVNTENNWGNTILINHLNGFYSQLSHLRKDSIKVGIGDFVKKNSIIASVGNSGRSPEPHLHIQFQNNPLIGSKTTSIPFNNFISRENKDEKFNDIAVPQEGNFVQNALPNSILNRAFHWKVGRKYRIIDNGTELFWEVLTTQYNIKYIHCKTTNSFLYFTQDDQKFCVLEYEGDGKAALFLYYSACYKILTGYHPQISITDKFPLDYFISKSWQWTQDFIAPFIIFIEVEYKSQIQKSDNEFFNNEIQIQSMSSIKILNKTWEKRSYNISIDEQNVNVKFKNRNLQIKLES